MQRTIRQPDAQARMLEEVGRYAWLFGVLKICWRRDYSEAARRPHRDGDHVAGHEVGTPEAKVEPRGHDVHDPTLGDDIDMNLRIAA